ncbi:methyl-accepting chemotaxis sensory transducer with Cache sensor [Acidovorax delafieldii]|uniref:Methyl-accepting chemotaxis sensory transducer with Cache sensor n=2 Tax=Acidovorax delafieldii TaxID=47920 RepID=A0A561XPF0_ACIDE|nr:methyl-accepting chemotaxis sensory transducer with Cache sensor [Acidovorax delafieldii]
MIPSSSRHSVAFKLSLTALLSLLAVLLATMGIVSTLLWKDFGRLARGDAMQYAAQVRTLVQTFDETAQEQAKRDFTLFKANFPGQFTVAESPGADGKPEAVLSFQGASVNGDFEVVDRFSKDSTGAVATIFARTGDDFIRVTTSLKKQDGERAYKTLLDRKHPAYALMNEGKTYIGRASLFGREYMTVYEPIRDGTRTIGILFIGSDMGAILGKLDTVMAGQKLFTSGAVYAVNLSSGPARGSVFGLPGAGKSLKLDDKDDNAKAWLASLAAVQSSGDLESGWSPRRSGESDTATRYVAVEHYRPWSWAIVAEAPLTEMMSEARGVLTWLWLGVAVALALLTVVLLVATRRLVGAPVQQLSTALGYLAQGDLTHAVSVRSRDEIGSLAQAMEGFRVRLVESLGTVRTSADSVSAASTEIAQGNQDLSGRTESQASALEQTAASMEQLGATIRHNADSASQANQLAVGASRVAQQGGEVVSKVVRTMQDINSSSQRIADIIGVIDGIAFQTNILALNAAVEAARAGEQGRGFAVVAAEVRNLAQRTAAEAKAIKELIGASSAMVQQGSVLADQAGATMQEVVSSIQRVADMVSEISAASSEQTAGVGQVGEAVTQLDQTTQQNAALVEEMAAAASSLRTQAQQMVEAIARFNLGQDATTARMPVSASDRAVPKLGG